MRIKFLVLLIVASAVAWIGASTANAATLRVCGAGCRYNTIQSAIDAAKPMTASGSLRAPTSRTYASLLRWRPSD
jgi:hypothetical protein